MKKRSVITPAALAACAGLLFAAAVGAHGGATGIVKERMDAMSAMSDASKAIGRMVKGEVAFSVEAVAVNAQTINEHSRDVVALFPPDSLQKASEALPVIWERWDEFEALAGDLETASRALIDVAGQGGDRKAVRARFARVGKSCKGCHEDFRQKKE